MVKITNILEFVELQEIGFLNCIIISIMRQAYIILESIKNAHISIHIQCALYPFLQIYLSNFSLALPYIGNN